MITTRSTLIVLVGLTSLGCPAEPKDVPKVQIPKDAPPSQPVSMPEPRTIAMEYVDNRCAGASPCMCRGELDTGRPELAKIGVDETALAVGTPCLLGDFDGNGHKDGAFLGKGFGEKLAVPVTVLMFDEGGLLALSSLPRNVGSLAILRGKDGSETLVEPQARTRFVYKEGKFAPSKM